MIGEVSEACYLFITHHLSFCSLTVPFIGSLGVLVNGTLVYKEVTYYRFPYPSNGVTLVLEVSNGSVSCYASNSLQNPNRKYGYERIVKADAYNDTYIDPSTTPGALGAYIYIGIEGRNKSHK